MIPAYERWWAENYNSLTSSGWGENIWQAATAQERERCIKTTRKTCQECYGLGKVLILHDVGRTEEEECARCSVLAAAIQETDDDV